MFIRVVVPAPFSPRSPRISPDRTVRSMRSFANTPGNRFVIPRSCSSTAEVLPVPAAGRAQPRRMREAPAPHKEGSPRLPGGILSSIDRDRSAAGDRNVPGDDVRLQGYELSRQLGRNGALEVVERSNVDAAVAQRAEVLIAQRAQDHDV